jgi:polysaccharide export outer membrane protein
MTRMVICFVFAVTCCLEQQELVAVAQQSPPAVAAEKSGVATTTKPGVADGVWSPALTGERRPLYRLQRSDAVEIDFTFSPEFDQVVTVQPDGLVALKGTKSIVAEGLTVPELQEAVRNAYDGILHDPEVTVVLKDFVNPFFIAAGEVTRPGKYDLRSETTVTEAVAIAGGFTQRAKHSQVVLFRKVSYNQVESRLLDVKGLLKSRTLGEDVQLKPGDLLYVPQNTISKIKQYLPSSGLGLYFSPSQF